MENQGIIVGKLQAKPIGEPSQRSNRMNAVFDFIDSNGNIYQGIKTYGNTADELLAKGMANQDLSLHFSLSLRTSAPNTMTGESLFALFVRDVGFRDINNSHYNRPKNMVDLEGTLEADPIVNHENGQPVADIKLRVIRRNISKEIDTRSGNGYDIMSIRLRNQTDVNLVSKCGKDSKVRLAVKIKPVPNSYLVTIETEYIEVFIAKPLMGMQQAGMNNSVGGHPATQQLGGHIQTAQSTNSGPLQVTPDGIIIDSNGTTYNFANIPNAAGQYSGYIVNSKQQLINSNGELINAQGQRVNEYGQIIPDTTQMGSVNTRESQSITGVNATGGQSFVDNGNYLTQQQKNIQQSGNFINPTDQNQTLGQVRVQNMNNNFVNPTDQNQMLGQTGGHTAPTFNSGAVNINGQAPIFGQNS